MLNQMPLQGMTNWLSRPAVRPFAMAFAISLAAHASIYTGYKMGQRLGLWETLQLPSWLLPLQRVLVVQPMMPPPAPEQQGLIPLFFVDVDPGLPSLQPTRETPYYGVVDTQAATPELSVEAEKPRMDGTQDKILKTSETVARTEPPQAPPEPAPPPREPEPAPAPVRESLKADPPPPGDLALAKPQEPETPATTPPVATQPAATPSATAQPATQPAVKPAPRPRPRTLAEVAERQSALVGEKYKQEGGSANRIDASALDVKGSPFGDYDARFIAAVQAKWDILLQGRRAIPGRVVVTFRLRHDGRVENMKVIENEVGELLGLICQKAILDPAPYHRWPMEMRREARNDYREVRFTFLYLH